MNPEVATGFRKAAKYLSMGGRLLLAQRVLRRCFRHARGVASVNDFDGDMKIDLDLSEHMQRRIFWMDYYNREIVALLKSVLSSGMVMVDVGANIGEVTLVAAKIVGHTGQVIAFEPMEEIAASLERNVRCNHLKQVVIARLGLADTISTASIYESCGQGEAGEENRGLGSLYGGSSTNLPAQIIQLTTLDAYFRDHPVRRLDVIKIDIEGAELPCLKGAAHTLRKFQPALIIEIQEQTSTMAGYRPEEILDYLEPFGYTFQAIGKNGRLTPIGRATLSSYQNVLCTPVANPARTKLPNENLASS